VKTRKAGPIAIAVVAIFFPIESLAQEWRYKSSFPRTRGSNSSREAYSGGARTPGCTGEQFKIVVDSKEIRVAGIEGTARVVVSNPAEIEPILEKNIVSRADTPIRVSLQTLDLQQGVTYQAFASRLCDLQNPSRNPSAVLQFQLPPSHS